MFNHLCLIIITTTLTVYILLDGRALAMCALMPLLNQQQQSDVYQFILPSWDANQTWLVFSLAALYGAYSSIFSSFFSSEYLIIFSMLIFFLVRGASIEFSLKAKTLAQKKIWHGLLALSSMAILFIQSVLIVFLLIVQQELAYQFIPSKVALAMLYVNATGFLIFFHAVRALDRLNLLMNKKLKLFLLATLFIYFSSNIIYFDFISLRNPLDYWQQHFSLLLMVLFSAAWLFLCYQKNCISCFLYLLALVSLAAIYYYLYPFHAPNGGLIFSQASSPITIKIIVIASIVCLPCLAFTMIWVSRFFNLASEKNIIDY